MNAKAWFFCFRPEIPDLATFGPKIKNQNSHFQLKFDAYANSSMKKSRWCSLFCFWPEIPFVGKSGQKKKKKINSLSWNLLDYCNLSMQNSVVMFTFSVLIQNYFVCRIWRIHLCCLLFLTGHTFLGQIWWKKSKLSV